MNERLRELYRRASEQARVQACEKNKTARPQNNTVWNEFVPLFAELIVRECMVVAASQRDPANLNYEPGEQFVEALELHFGVKK